MGVDFAHMGLPKSTKSPIVSMRRVFTTHEAITLTGSYAEL